MDKGEKMKKGLKTLGWLVAFPVPITKALAKKQGGKIGRKVATIAASWAMYASLATAGVAAMVPKTAPEDKTIDSVGYVVDEPGQIDEPVTNRLPNDIEIQDHTRILGVGEELSIIANVVPFNVDDEYAKLSWTSSDEAVATVNEYGKVTAVGLGTVEITAKTTNGITKSFEIVVAESRIVKANVRVTSENETFNLDDWNFYLYIDEDSDHSNFKPEVAISEDGYSADYQIVVGRTILTYVTFNYRYKSGMDTGYAAKRHQVTVEDLETGFEFILPVDFSHRDGDSDFPDENIVVTVDFEKKHPEVQQIEINNGAGNLFVGEERKLNVSLYPADAETSLTWTSSDESVATVDQNGVVTAHAEGPVVITVTAANGVQKLVLLDVVARQALNMRVSSSYVGHIDNNNWDYYYLVNGERLNGGRSIVTVGEELTFTVVFRKAGDDSVTYENSVTRTVTEDYISKGFNISMYVDVMEDNGMGREVEKEILARLDVTFE